MSANCQQAMPNGGTVIHVAILDVSRLEQDGTLQNGEDKLKLRCPMGHKVSQSSAKARKE